MIDNIITSSFSLKKGDLPASKEAMISLQEHERMSIIKQYEKLLPKYYNDSRISDKIEKAITTIKDIYILYKNL